MDILLWIGVFVAALAGLLYSADIFTQNAEKVGLAMGLSSFLVGAVITAIGTSLPEVITSLIATIQANGDPEVSSFAIDNVIGSNIANSLLVIGICAIVVRKLIVKKELIDIDLPFLFASNGLFLVFIMDGQFTIAEGVLSLVLLMVFMGYTLTSNDDLEEVDDSDHEKINPRNIVMLVLACGGIYLGGKYTIDSLMNLSEIFGITSSVLTMLLVALGTSLPEVVVSTKAALSGKHGVAVGNVFGSNVFNVLVVPSIPVFFGAVTVSGAAMTIGIPFFIISILALIFSSFDNKINSWEGIPLLVIYAAFVGKITGLF